MDFEMLDGLDDLADVSETAGGGADMGADLDSEDFFGAGFTDGADTTGQDDEAGADINPPDTTGESSAKEGGASAADYADTTAGAAGAKPDTTGEKGEAAGAGSNETDGNNAQKYTLKILGKEQEYTMPELLTLAQKGGDYDRIRTAYDGMRDDVFALRELAAARGKTTGELLSEISASEHERQVSELAQGMVQGGLDESIARALAENQVQMREFVNRQNAPAEKNRMGNASEAAANESRQQAVQESIRKLVQVYGITEMPEEAIKLSVDKGLLPFEAYQAYQMQQLTAERANLQQQLEQTRLNQSNAAKAVGSLQSAGGSADDDMFTAGFDAYL